MLRLLRGSRRIWLANGSFSSKQRTFATSPADPTTLPLAGIRILDMTRVLAGVSMTQNETDFEVYTLRSGVIALLHADPGRSRVRIVDLILTIIFGVRADVIKIEHPTRGDDTRAWGPPYAKHVTGNDTNGPGESAYFLSVNRNKKSLGLSFADRAGVDILHKLARNCDVLVENYLPGSLKKYGMDYETIKQINPSLIYASITGYGQTGPYSNRAGYDVMVEAEMGLMHITGSRDGPPVKVGVAVTDLTTGLYTSNSIMAALLGRIKTGMGQHIDAALSDCQVATLTNMASSALISGKKDAGRWGTAHREPNPVFLYYAPFFKLAAHPRRNTASIVPYRAFKTADGDILIGGGNDRLYGILCDKLGRPEWKTDKRFFTNSVRVENRDVLENLIEDETKKQTTDQWLAAFEGSGMPYAAINDIQGTLSHEHGQFVSHSLGRKALEKGPNIGPSVYNDGEVTKVSLVLAREMITEIEHPTCGRMKLVNTPVKYSHSKPSIRLPPPTLGQHTNELLQELVGLDEAGIKDLRAAGVVA
ncbi:MAG: hypothetical protein M1812_000417 [Candelaria pacifica]|nr:MAG: hypothetical protein M1812_000417 [Candelaria pacifica]